MRLLVGLGNPGQRYHYTRHNVGFWAIDQLAKQQDLTWEQFKSGELAKGKGFLLYKPQQFMNTSGIFVRQVLDFYQLTASDLCVVTDDVYILPGSARLRIGGGDGGHNGLKSLREHVTPDTFWRVKIGAGLYDQDQERRSHLPPLDEYVLQSLPLHERQKVEALIDKLLPNLIKWLQHGVLDAKTIHS